MRYLFFVFILFTLSACRKQAPINCEGKQPMWKECIEGEYKCMENTIEVPGMPASYGCVPKGYYNYICHNPCPPYGKLLMATNQKQMIKKDVNGLDAITAYLLPDINAIFEKGEWGHNSNETFWVKELPDGQGYKLWMNQISMYMFWDETKQRNSISNMEGRMTADRDSIYMTIHYGWDKERNYSENRCDLVFVKSNL